MYLNIPQERKLAMYVRDRVVYEHVCLPDSLDQRQ